MRFPDDYSTVGFQRQALALRMLRQEARTGTIVTWTQLGRDRIRGLALRLAAEQPDHPPHRYRGGPPTEASALLQPKARHREAAVFGVHLKQLGALDLDPTWLRVSPFETLERGEHLCTAYEQYRNSGRARPIPFDYAILVLKALAYTRRLSLVHCEACGAAWLIDPYGIPDQRCPQCPPRLTLASVPRRSPRTNRASVPGVPEQLPLFDFLPNPPAASSGLAVAPIPMRLAKAAASRLGPDSMARRDRLTEVAQLRAAGPESPPMTPESTAASHETSQAPWPPQAVEDE